MVNCSGVKTTNAGPIFIGPKLSVLTAGHGNLQNVTKMSNEGEMYIFPYFSYLVPEFCSELFEGAGLGQGKGKFNGLH